MNKAQAVAIAGTIGKPSKMPGMSYGLPAASASWVPIVCEKLALPVPLQYGCRVGAALAKKAGSVCNVCYADQRGNYTYPSVHVAQVRRLVGLYHPKWVDAMVFLIERQFDKMFADAFSECLDDFFADTGRMPYASEMGALEQQANHAVAYFRWHDSGDLLDAWHLDLIIEVCNRTPYLQHWLPTRETAMVVKSGRTIPDNLTIRHSAHMVGGAAPLRVHHTSTVTIDRSKYAGHMCPAQLQDNKCGDCRACWDVNVPNVAYPVH